MFAFTQPFAPLRVNNAISSLSFSQFVSPARRCSQPLTFSSTTSTSPPPNFFVNAERSTPQRKMPAVLRPVVPGPELLQFNVEDKAQQRSDILRVLNNYVREKNLQNPKDRRFFLCDDKLRALLGVDSCTYFGINRYISQYIRKPEELGGRYVEEAKQVEQQYLEKKELEGRTSTPKREKRTTKARVFKPVRLSEDLAVVCRANEMTRPDVLKAVWAYIRLNNLQSSSGKPIKCDFLLKKVFGVDQIDTRQIMGAISPHLTKIE